MADFSHLLQALRAGCPPHAGLAIGFDRLVAVMQGRETVRDVIAFPKNNNAEDPMVRSPSLMQRKQLMDYHIKVEDYTIRGAPIEKGISDNAC
jgi:aspartyl-tRNA synthetase